MATSSRGRCLKGSLCFLQILLVALLMLLIVMHSWTILLRMPILPLLRVVLLMMIDVRRPLLPLRPQILVRASHHLARYQLGIHVLGVIHLPHKRNVLCSCGISYMKNS